MASLFGLNKPNTNLRKNVFDLSEKGLYSMSPGMLLPVMTKEVNPGEKFEINVSSIARTMPLNTAAFVRCKRYFHFFFVPYRQLWSGWDNFINGVDYKRSVFQKDSVYKRVPHLDISNTINRFTKEKLLFSLYNKVDGKSVDIAHLRGLRDASVSSRGYAEWLDKHPEYKDLPNKYTISELLNTNSVDVAGFPLYLGMSRLLDMLDYGIDFGNGMTLKEFVDSRISLDQLDSLVSMASPFGSILNSIKINPFRLLAYQKIYADFYKRDDFEATDPECWNIDDLYNKNLDSYSVDRLRKIFTLRYRWLPKDYFTGVVPSELYGIDSVLTGLTNSMSGVNSSDLSLNSDKNAVDVNGNVSTRSIRAAFAIEKLLRLTRRAGGFDYISQTAAHYGFEVPKGRADQVDFLGGFSSYLDISEVVTTSSYANEVQGNFVGNTVGQVFGKGVGVSTDNKPINFTAPEHGLIMCIESFVPESDYNAYGLSRFNSKFERGDYFHPEFQDLGLQPVFGYELRNNLRRDVDNIRNPISDSSGRRGWTLTPKRKNNDLLGFVPMYSEYKTSYDKLHGIFKDGRSMSAWASSMRLDYGALDSSSSGNRGLFSSTLRVSPSALDSITGIAYDGSEDTDTFICSSQFMVKAIRPMSVTGQNL